MDVRRDFLHVKDSVGAELFVQDMGYLGVYLILLRGDGQWARCSIAPHDLGDLLMKLQTIHTRNELELTR